MAKFNTKSISNQGTLAPKRKIYKTSMKHLKIHKFPFKTVIVLAIECKMYLKIQKKLCWLGCISKQTLGSAVKKWISVTKISKYGQNEYSRALNSSYTLSCVASVSVRFRNKERGTKVKDRAKNGASKRARRGGEERKETSQSKCSDKCSEQIVEHFAT